MVARSVRCRVAPVRRAPVARRRSSSRATRSGGRRPGCGRRPARWRAECHRGGGRSLRRHPDAACGSKVWSTASARSVEQLHSRGGIQRPDDQDLLTVDAEALTRRRQHPQLRAAFAMAWTSSAAPAMTCSQLSMTSSADRDRRDATIDWVSVPPPSLGDAQGVGHGPGHIARRRRSPPVRSARLPRRSTAAVAAANASLVLPIPPGPTSVTTGDRASASLDGIEVVLRGR